MEIDLLMQIVDKGLATAYPQYALGAYFASKAFSILFPSKVQGWRWYNYFSKVVNIYALNVGKARNADDEETLVRNNLPRELVRK